MTLPEYKKTDPVYTLGSHQSFYAEKFESEWLAKFNPFSPWYSDLCLLVVAEINISLFYFCLQIAMPLILCPHSE